MSVTTLSDNDDSDIQMARSRLPSKMSCIYCGTIGETLTDEHIVPFGLGGTDVLKSASCDTCRQITGEVIEHACLRKILLSPRTHWGIKTRRPKERPIELPVGFGEVGSSFQWAQVPVAEHPLTFMLPIFSAPGLLKGEAPRTEFPLLGVWQYVEPDAPTKLERLSAGKIQAGDYQPFSPDLFCRMLAKIGHCHAASKFELDRFHPLLPDIIIGHSNFISYLVGGSVTRLRRRRPKDDDHGAVSHKLSSRIEFVPGGLHYLIVSICLFDNLGAPEYDVVVGLEKRV